ncbi:hypothetical protein [Streptomyces sp. NPDC056883]|uniref:hypothetical protein n=1 Tax=Streptomyces sp. NPDC056883 TaxID=3345959 RepID=UPI0036BB15C7
MEIRDNLLAPISEAEREGRLVEIEVLRASLAGAESKIDQLDATSGGMPIHLGMPRQAPAQPAPQKGAEHR